MYCFSCCFVLFFFYTSKCVPFRVIYAAGVVVVFQLASFGGVVFTGDIQGTLFRILRNRGE